MKEPSAQEINSIARDLLDRSDTTTAGLWPRASALLARQALELGMAELWESRRIGSLASCSNRAQLLCLAKYLGNEELAEQASHVWWALARACHHHPYELAPIRDELDNLLQVVQDIVRKMATEEL